MTNVNIQTEHIIAYLEGKLSKEDSLAFEKQMLDSPELRKEVDDLRFICDTSQMLYLQEKIDVDNHWKNVSRTMQKNRFRQKIGRYFRYTAAILLIPALISSIYFYQRIYRLENQPIEQVELSSAYGLVSKITLPDGSEVWLNSGSKLHYPKQFVGNHRKVYLSGEAYFKVSSDKKHRFDVALSNGITVSAYGTEFNINAYEDDDEIQATLANGSIEIRNEKKPIPQVLNPGEQAVYNKITDNTKVSDINLYMVTSWKEGKMVFRRTEMAEIAQRLSRHFNVNIILQSKKIFNYKYSATFTTETFEEILQLLEKTAFLVVVFALGERCGSKEKRRGKENDFFHGRLLFIIFYLSEFAFVKLDRVFQPVIERVADQRVADRDFVGPRDAADEKAQVFEIEVVSGIQAESLTAGLLGRREIGRQRGFGAGGVFAGVGLGIKLHPVGAAGLRPGDHRRIGIDENRDPDAFLMEPRRDFGQESAVGKRVPPGIRRNGVMGVGHEGHLRRHDLQHQIDEARNRIALDIEFGPQQRTQIIYICPADVAFVGTGMNSNTVSPESFTIKCYLHHIGDIPSACISQCSNLVYVYT